MIIALDVAPVECPSLLHSRNLMIWGDDAAMEAMRVRLEARGWIWATMRLEAETKALVLRPPASVGRDEICALIDQVNGGRFGKLGAGFARMGQSQDDVDEVEPR